MEDWKEYLKGHLNSRIIHFIDLHFRSLSVKNPTMKDISEIPEDRMMNSWLSIPSMKELMLFQQQLKENGLKTESKSK